MSTAPKLAEIVRLPPDADIIEHLEHHLEQAKSGRYIACAVVAVTTDNEVDTSTRTLGHARTHLLGAIEVLKARMLSGILRGMGE